MLLKLGFAVTIPNVSGRRTRAADYPATFKVAALDSLLRLTGVGSLCKVIISNHRTDGAQMSSRFAAHLPLGINFHAGRVPVIAPTLVPRIWNHPQRTHIKAPPALLPTNKNQ